MTFLSSNLVFQTTVDFEIQEHTISFQTFFVWALLLTVHT